MAKQQSKQHAEHIENACSYLDKCNEFPDWVITTCFYASLHYLRHKIFPVNFKMDRKLPAVILNTYDEYYTFICQREKKMGRHERFKCLVEEKCSISIAADYAKLLDFSYGARYSNYNYEKEYVENAKSKLLAIKKYCISTSSVPAPNQKSKK